MPVACRHVIQITAHSYPGHHHCQTLARDAGPVTGVGESRAGKMVSCRVGVGCVSFLYSVVMCMLYSGRGSTHIYGCMVNGIFC